MGDYVLAAGAMIELRILPGSVMILLNGREDTSFGSEGGLGDCQGEMGRKDTQSRQSVDRTTKLQK